MSQREQANCPTCGAPCWRETLDPITARYVPSSTIPIEEVLKQERAVGFREGYELAESRSARVAITEPMVEAAAREFGRLVRARLIEAPYLLNWQEWSGSARSLLEAALSVVTETRRITDEQMVQAVKFRNASPNVSEEFAIAAAAPSAPCVVDKRNSDKSLRLSEPPANVRGQPYDFLYRGVKMTDETKAPPSSTATTGETPRTDEFASKLYADKEMDEDDALDFARQLERELAEANRQLADVLATNTVQIADMQTQLVAARSAATMDDTAWLHRFISCVPFGAAAPPLDIVRAHKIVDALAAQPTETLTTLERARLGQKISDILYKAQDKGMLHGETADEIIKLFEGT